MLFVNFIKGHFIDRGIGGPKKVSDQVWPRAGISA